MHGEMYTDTATVPYAGTAPVAHDAVIPVYDDSGNVIETHEHKGDFKETVAQLCSAALVTVSWLPWARIAISR